MVKKAIIYHHLGLGDHFTCNALVHHIAKGYDEIYVACKRRNEHTVKHMYEDYPNINIFEVDKEPNDIFDFSTISEIPVIKIGFEHTDPFNFEESFYKQYGLSLDNKNTEFKLPTNLSKSILYYLNISNEFPNEYIFVHDESTAGKYNLNIESDLDRFVVEKEDTNDIFDYVHTICAAKLKMQVTSPSGVITNFSTEDSDISLGAKKIIKDSECGPNNCIKGCCDNN